MGRRDGGGGGEEKFYRKTLLYGFILAIQYLLEDPFIRQKTDVFST